MPDLQEVQCPEPETLAGLCQRVAALEARVMPRKRPSARDFRLTRPDRTRYGWKVDPRDSARLVPDPAEQEQIVRICGLSLRQGLGPRAICRYLDAHGSKRRGGRWVGHHSTVRSILERNRAELARMKRNDARYARPD